MNQLEIDAHIEILRRMGEYGRPPEEYFKLCCIDEVKVVELPAIDRSTAEVLAVFAERAVPCEGIKDYHVERILRALPDSIVKRLLQSIWNNAPHELQEQCQLFCLQYQIPWPVPGVLLRDHFPEVVKEGDVKIVFQDRDKLVIAPCTLPLT